MGSATIHDIDELRRARLAKLNARAHWLEMAERSSKELQVITEHLRMLESMVPYERCMPVDHLENGIG